MIDLHYKNHNLVKTENDFIHKCIKCNILVWNTGAFDDNIYLIVSSHLYHTGRQITKNSLTCEELIIKDVLE